jgi:hypothetical protein
MSFQTFRIKIRFHGEELLASRPYTKLEDNPLSDVRDCLFNIFAATLQIGGHFPISNLTTCHAVVTEKRMRWAGNVERMGRVEAYTGSWWGNLREGDHLGDPGLDGRIILRWIFRKWD